MVETHLQPSAPHITWSGEDHHGRLEWLKWLFLLLIAAGTAVAGFFLFPHR